VDSLSEDEAALCRRAYKQALFLPERYDALCLCACGEIYLDKKAACPICKTGFLGMEALLADEAKRAKQYAEAKALCAEGFVDAEKALAILSALGDYKDAAALAEECRARLTSPEAQYAEAKALDIKKPSECAKALSIFKALGDYKDAADLAKSCRSVIRRKKGKTALFVSLPLLVLIALTAIFLPTQLIIQKYGAVLEENGYVVTSYADQPAQSVVIPDTIGGRPVVAIGDYAY
jgi:hypothetical protein